MFNGYHDPRDARKAGDYGLPTAFSFRKGLIGFIILLIIASLISSVKSQEFTPGEGGTLIAAK